MSDKKELNVIENLQSNEKSLWIMVQDYKPKLLKIACESIQNMNTEKQNQFLMKTIISIVKNDNLKECFNTPEGKYSIFEIIRNCIRTGLILDLHAFAVPQSKKVKKNNNDVWIKEARFDIRDRGYHALLVGGEKPIFKELKWDIVYSKDMEEFNKFNEILINQKKEPKHFIDPITNEINHIQAICEDRGNLLGVWVSCVHFDNKKESKFFPKKFIESCRDKSPTYQKFIKKELSTCVWNEFPQQMYIKTAIKSFCKYWADISDALQSAYYAESEEIIDDKRIDDVADIIIDKALDNLQENFEEKKPEIKKEDENKKETLF